MILTYADYTAVYGEGALSQTAFDLIDTRIEAILDDLTTGIDGVHKLRVAFPTDETDAAAIRDCAISMVHAVAELDALRTAALSGSGGMVSSKSSGSESISYATGGTADLMKLSVDPAAQRGQLAAQARIYLSGRQDANGVNLLYMGPYPYTVTEET